MPKRNSCAHTGAEIVVHCREAIKAQSRQFFVAEGCIEQFAQRG
jgi:hypothetical protein